MHVTTDKALTERLLPRSVWLDAAEELLRTKPRLLRRDYAGNDRAYLVDRARTESDLRAGLFLLEEIRMEPRICTEDLERARSLSLDGRVHWVRGGLHVLAYQAGIEESWALNYRGAVCIVLGRAWWTHALSWRVSERDRLRLCVDKFGSDIVGRLMLR